MPRYASSVHNVIIRLRTKYRSKSTSIWIIRGSFASNVTYILLRQWDNYFGEYGCTHIHQTRTVTGEVEHTVIEQAFPHT